MGRRKALNRGAFFKPPPARLLLCVLPYMPAQDFFTFCTSLLPIELKALGALSEARHIPEGETIYTVGEPAVTLYIINRGVIEMVHEPAIGAAPATYLSRGDIFGDLEVLTGRPRQQRAHTREAASLRCFRRQDFPELQRRVPSFFRYLCEQLANRLVDIRNAAISQSHCLELTGSLTKFDLVAIFQTITHSSQTGELSILSENGETIAAFYFESGQPLGGRFRHLSGEEAFWQLFLADDLHGTFSFASGEQTQKPPQDQLIARKADDMLITAIQSRDEFQPLKSAMPSSAILELQKPAFRLEMSEDANSQALMEQIWRRCAEETTSLGDLSAHFSVCELKIYRAVQELVRTGHLALSAAEEAQKVA